ncbi:hypothetical protein [Spiroplasma endosymbiont of Nebria brevicollis]|uniref:hypothetical protein n=1 Tax=Spiroplasma endosymbiont of Nebria brevicollis TaxID=3066284 RepID=UPI00313D645E
MKESSGKQTALASYNSGDATNVAELAQKAQEKNKKQEEEKALATSKKSKSSLANR